MIRARHRKERHLLIGAEAADVAAQQHPLDGFGQRRAARLAGHHHLDAFCLQIADEAPRAGRLSSTIAAEGQEFPARSLRCARLNRNLPFSPIPGFLAWIIKVIGSDVPVNARIYTAFSSIAAVAVCGSKAASSNAPEFCPASAFADLGRDVRKVLLRFSDEGQRARSASARRTDARCRLSTFRRRRSRTLFEPARARQGFDPASEITVEVHLDDAATRERFDRLREHRPRRPADLHRSSPMAAAFSIMRSTPASPTSASSRVLPSRSRWIAAPSRRPHRTTRSGTIAACSSKPRCRKST